MMKIKFNKKGILICLLAAAVALSGCTKGKDKKSESEKGADALPAVGGTINLSTYPPDTLNPLATQYSSVRDFLDLIYEGLFVVNEDFTASGVLAKDYTSESNTVFHISLKNGIKFHDGSDLTSADVISTFTYIQTHDTVYSANLADVAAYNADGNYSVVIRLKTPNKNFVNNLDFPILPSGLTSGAFAVPNATFVPIGTGRYCYSHTVAYNSVELKSFDSWHGGGVYVPNVSVRFVDDNQSMLYAFDSGETDMITTDRARWGEYPYSGKFETSEVTGTRYVYLGVNTSSGALADTELRKTISSLINRSDMTDNVFFSHAKAAASPIPRTAFFADKSAKIKNVKLKKTDEKYNELRDKKYSFYLLYDKESKLKQQIADYIKESLEYYGIKIIFSAVDYETYLARVNDNNYQMYIGEVRLGNDLNLDFLVNAQPVQGTPDTAQGGDTANESEVQTEEEAQQPKQMTDSDKLAVIVSNLNNASTEKDLSIACTNLDAFFADTAYHIPLVHMNDAMFVNKRLHGSIKKNLSGFYSDIGEVYINKKQ